MVRATENLSAFTEYYLVPLAGKHPSYLKDTTHLLTKLQKISEERTFPLGTLLVSWDVEAMFPNIDKKLGLKAVRKALNSRSEKSPSTQCILSAVELCLKCNNSHSEGKHYTQIEGTAKGPKNSCCYTDIAMIDVDFEAMNNGPYTPEF